MSKVLIEQSNLSSIANAIRSKNGASTLYLPSDMAEAIIDIPTGITPTGAVNISQNGIVDVTQYASAAVAVPNSYAAGDEGKVVSNGVLVAQTARASEITQNGTYDTTNNNSVIVNVSGGGGGYYRVQEYTYDGTNLVDELYVESGITLSFQGGYATEASGTVIGTSITITSNIVVYVKTPIIYKSKIQNITVVHYDDRDVWFFQGFYINSIVEQSIIDPMLRPFIPYNSGYTGELAKAYNNDESSSWTGNVGRYGNGFRLLSPSNANYINGAFWSTVEFPPQSGTPTQNIGGGIVQMTEYVTPEEYIAQHSV